MKNSWLPAALILATFTGCSSPIDRRESSGDKREWSILQNKELQLRQSVVDAPEFVEVEGYSLLVIPTDNQSRNIWIMLAPKSPPFYKQLPQGNYTIPRSLLDTIARQRMASSTVEEVLASHVAE